MLSSIHSSTMVMGHSMTSTAGSLSFGKVHASSVISLFSHLLRGRFHEQMLLIVPFHSNSVKQNLLHIKGYRLNRAMCASDTTVLEEESLNEIRNCDKVKKKVAMWVGYIGTSYKGLQIQRSTAAGQTIEEELEKAIFNAGGILESNMGNLYKIGWMRSSRTDKGVHSISTVISLKMEVPRTCWVNDPDGIQLADSVNAHLPKTVQVFGIVPVTKSFNPRRECSNRTYQYLLPAGVLGLGQDSTPHEITHCLQHFGSILSLFQGVHPFHNYTVRSIYRKTPDKPMRKYVDRSCEKLQVDGLLDDPEIPKSDADSLKPSAEHSGEDDCLSRETQSASCKPPCDTNAVEELDDDSESAGALNPETNQNASISRFRVRWLEEPDMNDKIDAVHFRKIVSFTCGDMEILGGVCFVRINIQGESFMLHQIRKMIGTAVAVMRKILPADIILSSLTRNSRVVLPLAPPEGLILFKNEFFPFRSNFFPMSPVRNTENLARLKMSDRVAERADEFCSNMLVPDILPSLDHKNPLWSDWLLNLEDARIPEEDFEKFHSAYIQWKEKFNLIKESSEIMS